MDTITELFCEDTTWGDMSSLFQYVVQLDMSNNLITFLYLHFSGLILQQPQLPVWWHGNGTQVEKQEVIVQLIQVIQQDASTFVITCWK